MTDSYDYIKENDIVYHAKGENESIDRGIYYALSRDYHKPYADDDKKLITLDDYYLKYKPEIIITEIKKPKGYLAENYYVNLDSDKNIERKTIEMPDYSKDLDIKIGTRVRIEDSGNYYCGLISGNNKYTMRAVFGGESYSRSMYKVKLDNGIEVDNNYFEIKEDCGEIEQPPIKYDNEIKFPRIIWAKIISEISRIKSGKQRLASRKKQSYRDSDQKHIESHTKALMNSMSAFLAWELANKEYVENITGEPEAEQTERRKLWSEKLNIVADNSAVVETVKPTDIQKHKELISATQLEKAETKKAISEKLESVQYPNDITKGFVSVYLSGKDDFDGKMQLDNYIYMFAGDSHKSKRQSILSAILGRETTKVESGVTAIRTAILDFIEKKGLKIGDETKKNKPQTLKEYHEGIADASERNWKENTPIKEVFEKAGKKYPEPEKKEIISETMIYPTQTDQDLIDLAFEMGEKANKTGGSRASAQNKEFMDFFYQKGEPPIDTIKILDAYIKGFDSVNTENANGVLNITNFIYGDKFGVPKEDSETLQKELEKRVQIIRTTKDNRGLIIKIGTNNTEYLIYDNGGEFNIENETTKEFIDAIAYDTTIGVKHPKVIADEVVSVINKYINKSEPKTKEEINVREKWEEINDWVFYGGDFDIKKYSDEDLRLYFKHTAFGHGKPTNINNEGVKRSALMDDFNSIVRFKNVEDCQKYLHIGVIVEKIYSILKYNEPIQFACKQISGNVATFNFTPEQFTKLPIEKAEQTKESLEKLLKGLEIQAKYKPTDELTKRINGLKIVLKYKK